MSWSRRPSDKDTPDDNNPLADNMRLNRPRRTPDQTQPLNNDQNASIYDQHTVVDNNFSSRSQARRDRQGASSFSTQQLGTWAANPDNSRKLLMVGGAFLIFLILLALIRFFSSGSAPDATDSTGTGASAPASSAPFGGAFTDPSAEPSTDPGIGAVPQPVATIPGSNPTQEQPPAGGGAAFVVTGTGVQGLFVRKEASTGAEKLGTLPEGTRIEAAGEQVNADGRNWQRVRTAFGEGWVAADFIQPAP